MICFQISIFEPLETTELMMIYANMRLWFAFKLVSLNHWKQQSRKDRTRSTVVICFQISIFEPLETTTEKKIRNSNSLWFAFKLVSLNHWKQRKVIGYCAETVVICFQISIFEPLETTFNRSSPSNSLLWFAFKLVSLNHWKQRIQKADDGEVGCDLLSN